MEAFKKSLRDFVHMLFSEGDSTLQIKLFNVWHFVYLFAILGMVILLTCLFRGKSERARETVVKVFVFLTIGLYVADFFIMPLSDSYSGIATHKLPFHICTLMGVISPFVQFNKKLKPVKPAVITLSIMATLTWMCYPGTALGGQPPFCYLIFQTFMYHGVLFAWAILNLTLGLEKLKISKIWIEACMIGGVFVWAWFGNTVYDGAQNWFFVEDSIIGFIPDSVIPIVVVIASFVACLLIHGVNCLCTFISGKISKLKQARIQKANESVGTNSQPGKNKKYA